MLFLLSFRNRNYSEITNLRDVGSGGAGAGGRMPHPSPLSDYQTFRHPFNLVYMQLESP